MGVYKRQRAGGPVYWISFQHEGKQRREPVGTDKREAERMLARRRREVADGTYDPNRERERAPALRTYARRFLEGRTIRSARDEEAIFRLHIDPPLGDLPLDEITPQVVAAWIGDMREAGAISAKTIRNVHAVLSTILKQARFEGLVETNAAQGLPRGILPAAKAKGAPPYSREELGVLLGHPDIPGDARVLIALMGLAGLRLGEACGRRWHDLDTRIEPLWCLHVHDQYDGEPLKGASEGDRRERWVPVHPVLRDILTEWHRHGFEEQHGRPPRDDDPISPWPQREKPRSEHQAGNTTERAAAAAGIERIRGRRAHSLRRSFISLARSDGAQRDVLERITHNAKGEVIERYTWLDWPALCAAVSALRVVPLEAMPTDAAAHSPELLRPGELSASKSAARVSAGTSIPAWARSRRVKRYSRPMRRARIWPSFTRLIRVFVDVLRNSAACSVVSWSSART